MAARYVIPDEPRPSGLSHLVVNPVWPLFAQMLGGSWLALPWFALNGLALGSPTRMKEWACLLASLLGSGFLMLLLVLASDRGWLGATGIRIAGLSIIALKISIAYALYLMQSRSFELWEYFGGMARNGIFVVAAGYFLENRLFALLVENPLLRVVLG